MLPWLLRIAPLMLLCGSASAQPHPTHPCASITAAAQRLACFDAAFPGAVDPEAIRAQEAAEFGLTRAQIRTRGGHIEPEVPERVEATIAKVSGQGSGRVVTLENGQIWQQTENSPLGVLAPGDRVAIKRGSFGSYLLVTASSVTLRVRRLK